MGAFTPDVLLYVFPDTFHTVSKTSHSQSQGNRKQFFFEILQERICPVPDLAPFNVLLYESGILRGHKHILFSSLLTIKNKSFGIFMWVGSDKGNPLCGLDEMLAPY